MFPILIRYFLLSSLLLPELANATTYAVGSGDLIGQVVAYATKEEDNLYEIARRHDIGIVELLAANPNTDPWMPKKDTELTITTAHILPKYGKGIVINLPELRLFYFLGNGTVFTAPIGIGMDGWQTPTGTTKIIGKKKDPAWIPPPSIRAQYPDLPAIIPAGDDNPLGKYALYLGWKNYLIHGTNRPYGIGKRSSHGCIRMYPEDIEELFQLVKPGTKVIVTDEQYKLGWQDNDLLLEVTPTQQQADDIAGYQVPPPLSLPEIYLAVSKAATGNTEIDWYEVENAVAKRSGIPTIIGKRN